MPAQQAGKLRDGRCDIHDIYQCQKERRGTRPSIGGLVAEKRRENVTKRGKYIVQARKRSIAKMSRR